MALFNLIEKKMCSYNLILSINNDNNSNYHTKEKLAKFASKKINRGTLVCIDNINLLEH